MNEDKRDPHYLFERRFLEEVKAAMKKKKVTGREMAEKALLPKGSKERSDPERAWYCLFAQSSVTGKPQRLTLAEAHAMAAVLGLDFARFCVHIELLMEIEKTRTGGTAGSEEEEGKTQH